MNNTVKKFLVMFTISLFLLMPVAFADDGDYTIPEANVDINISDDGTAIITETITQDIEGSVNGVYREIPIAEGQSISDVHVTTPGYYNTPEIITNKDNVKIKVWLYKDPTKTQKIYDDKVTVTYKYRFNRLVKMHNDIAEFQYLTWGNQWDSRVDKLTTTITLPSNEDVQTWNNPPDYVDESTWINNTTLKTQLSNIPSHTAYEQRFLIPKTTFKPGDKFITTGLDAKDKIIQDQEKYLSDREFKKTVSTIVNTILGLLLFVPFGIYALFGREPKIDYKSEYEYDTPTDDSPLFVNNVVVGNVGEFDVNAYNATILSLIDRKYYNIIASNANDTIIRRSSKDLTDLKKYERDIITFLSSFERNNDISFNYIKDNCDPTEYTSFISNWKQTAESEISQQKVDSYFDDKGSTILNITSGLMIALSVILFIFTMFMDESFFNIILVVLMFVVGVMTLSIPNTFAGRWTPEGKQFHDKWKSFENYITDYSMIKDYPPASIQVWGKYLVYATALGCAKEVSDNMFNYFKSVNLSEDNLYQSDIVWFSYYGGLNNMTTSFSHIEAAANSSSSGGISSVGGGFGGGGGGTF
ncbi:MAG: hypothetical protein BZ137_06095 [Methanosphaera sp. rholeuAM130]|nr:MAG: hypothetical protein BZ137_06095 [Methanosphaera sp. rholeuAM130]